MTTDLLKGKVPGLGGSKMFKIDQSPALAVCGSKQKQKIEADSYFQKSRHRLQNWLLKSLPKIKTKISFRPEFTEETPNLLWRGLGLC